MSETFAQYLEKWLKQSTGQGLNNPLVKMPVSRFRKLDPTERATIADGGTMLIGTMSDPIARNLLKNFQMRIRERGEHCAFICTGSIAMTIAGAIGQQPRAALFPICLKRASLQASNDKVKVVVLDDEPWRFNPVLEARLRDYDIQIRPGTHENPDRTTAWMRTQLGNRATQVTTDTYVGLFSSQQMVVHERLSEPLLRQALAKNPLVQAKIAGTKVAAIDLGHTITDDGLEELGFVLPSDDSQLRVVQLSSEGCSLQVEGPPGTGKSQTIANIISNALYQGRTALLVCDKKAAIVQVEERLTNCGLKPALLNLHDEDLDKREFLKQATDKFPPGPNPRAYPLTELRETRKLLNERVTFGRATAHASLQVTNQEALAGLIQLRKELKQVPPISIANWQSLSKERLGRLLNSLGEWPGLSEVVSDGLGVWNNVRPEAFDDNPNAANELQGIVQRMLAQLESVQEVREQAISLGIELPLQSDRDAEKILNLVNTVITRPRCHPQVVGNHELSVRELNELKEYWDKRDALIARRHPVPLEEQYPPEAEAEAKSLTAAESAKTWSDLSARFEEHAAREAELHKSQKKYQKLCDQIGFIYSPLLKVRRAQLQAAINLGQYGGIIPRSWWQSSVNPVLAVNGWIAKLRACITHHKRGPLPVHFVALERVTQSHWEHVEAMAEHGFNAISYCLKFVNDRKCKYALRQAYPNIPTKGFKLWREVTLHAVSARTSLHALRAAADVHAILKQLTENYLSLAHEVKDGEKKFVDHDDVQRLQKSASLVEQWRSCNDLFQIESIHWQTFWESPNPNLLSQVTELLEGLDSLPLPDYSADSIDAALTIYSNAKQRIQTFLSRYETREGDRKNRVTAAFAAQKDFADYQNRLTPLRKYTQLQENSQGTPDWSTLAQILEWRDLFEKLRREQRLDIDSVTWPKLRDRLENHLKVMTRCSEELDSYFEPFLPKHHDFDEVAIMLSALLTELPQQNLWLEKKRWQKKIPAFPELKPLWEKIVDGAQPPEHAQRLFCFNLLRLCKPIAEPHGPALKQTLASFVEQDEHLTSWVVDHLKARVRKTMQEAATTCAESEAELRRLSGLQRVRGTIRELANQHLDYLLAGKPCWMMSPTSLANLIDSQIFDEHGIPFDLVIFDEASQIRVLDGLLSMAFGKQVIIVGDKNQLPPTDFFTSFANPGAEETQDLGTSESLLDEFSGVFEEEKTHVMLMSHYRSETPDLIRFSNDWFYAGRLEMYPPAHISGIGRRLHYVPDGIYAETAGQRNNPQEAKEVVKLIEQHVREYPDKSLGIVTMNIPQMELIDEQLQICLNAAVRAFCADESKFFLRNLETVQGDEMDRIILSLTYGKNPSGHFSASVLGPLTKSGGERRLNVAITRSRNGMIVVSSLKAADLESTGAQSKGFVCLKALLHDLESMEQRRDYGISSERFTRKKDGISNVVYCDSPFEEQVVEFLENEGCEIECQYGAGNFSLDIVVKERGKNLLAIECDGAGYHSSLVARTRDRARQRILEKLGWRVHRVWSTNWWYFEQQEKEAIIAAINAAREALPRHGRTGGR